MKTSYKAFAFAVLAAFVVAFAAVPAEDASAADITFEVTGVQYFDEYKGTAFVLLSAVPDENMFLTIMDSDGNKVSESTLLAAKAVAVSAFPAGTFSSGAYVLPAEDSAITAGSLYKICGVSSGYTYLEQVPGEPAVTKYKVTVAADIENGTVSTDKIEAAEGETVILTVTADDGYKVGTVSAGDIAVIADSTGAYSFTMPAQDVTVSATFEAVETPVEPEQVLEIVSVGYAAEDANVTINSALAAAGYEGAPVTDADPASVMYVVFTMSVAGTISVAVDGVEADNTIDFAAGVHAVYWAAEAAPGETVEIVIADGDVSAKAEYTFEAAPVEPSVWYTVTYGEDIEVFDSTGAYVASGDKVAENAVLTVTAVEKTGQIATVSPALTDGKYIVTEDVEFAVSYAEKDYENASLSGVVKTDGTRFTEDQLVTISADTTVVSGANLTILGKLVVDDGVTLTIESGAYIAVAGVAEIRGTVVIDAAESDDIYPGALIAYQKGVVTVYGAVSVAGNLGSMGDGQVVVAAGSSVEISETGAVVGSIVIADSASMTVAGSFGYAGYPVAFQVAGDLVVDTAVPAQAGFSAKLTFASASVTVASMVFGDEVESGVSADIDDAVIAVTDQSGNAVLITVSLTRNGDAPADADQYPVSSAATVSGITVSGMSAVVDKKTVYTIVLSGDIAAESYTDYLGLYTETAPVYDLDVTVGVVGANAASIAASSVGEGIVLDVSGKATVDSALSLGKGAVLEASALSGVTVNAPVDAMSENSKVVNNGVLTVKGEGSVTAVAAITPAQTSASYNGAYYITGKAAETVYHYVTIDAALAALNDGITDSVSLYGAQTITQDFTLLAKDKVVLESGATLRVGEKEGDDVTLAVASTGSIVLTDTVGKQIVVNGTLFAESYRDVSRIANYVDSQVYSCDVDEKGKQKMTSWAKWTNVYTALGPADEGGAKSGETVALQKEVSFTKDVEIREGVTLDAQGFSVTVGNDTVLTVTGTLDLTDAGSKLVLAEKVDKTSTTAAKAAGSAAISGYVLYRDAAQIPAGMAGAYYAVTAKSVRTMYLTSYANGAADVLKADGYAVTMRSGSDGKVALGEISVTGESDKVVTVVVDGDLSGTITLSYATVAVPEGKKIDATISGCNGSVAVLAEVGDDGFAVTDALYPAADAKDAFDALSVRGELYDYTGDKGKEVDTSIAFSGSVHAVGVFTTVDSFVIAGTLTVADDLIAADMDVQGNLVVSGGYAFAIKLNVSGAASVTDGTLAALEAIVTGSVDATAAEDAEAEFSVLYLYIGTDGEQFIGADASVTGNVDLGDYALAVPGAAVPASFDADDSPYVKTVFYAGNAVYLVAYGITSNSMEIVDVLYSQENAEFLGWENEDGVVASGEFVGADGFEVVTAKVDLAIYSIQITTDGGINYITIGGKLLTNVSGNVFAISGLQYTSDLTLVFQGKAGYDTTGVKLYDTDGNATGIQLPSATKKTTVSYQLIGSTPSASAGQSTVIIDTSGIIDAIDKNTEATENIRIEGGSSKDSSLTDILLIVLVILIVIMAILVAMRMMRS